MQEQAQPLLIENEAVDSNRLDFADSDEKYDEPKSLFSLKGGYISIHWQRLNPQAAMLSSVARNVFPRYLQPGGLEIKQRPHSTAYLDSMRGFAALFVMNLHSNPLADIWLMQLPFIRVTYAGGAMVDLFFVISGFVLSQRLIQQARQKQKPKLMDSVASALFRRWMRLFLPCAFVSFVVMILVHTGFTNPPDARRKDTIPAQLWDWIWDLIRFVNPFGHVDGWVNKDSIFNSYVGPTWTIPVEFRGSIIVYVFCAATAKLRPIHRLTVGFMIYFMSFVWCASYCATFMAGVMLAEISLIRHPERYVPANALPQIIQEPPREKTSRRWASRFIDARIFYGTACAVSLLLMGPPRRGGFPYHQLFAMIPSSWEGGPKIHFYNSIFAPLLVWSIDEWQLLQKPLLWKFPLYLGELSFGIYLTHQAVIYSQLQKGLNIFSKTILGDNRWALLLMMIMRWLIVFWLADYFDRVDKYIVRLVRRLQQKFFETW